MKAQCDHDCVCRLGPHVSPTKIDAMTADANRGTSRSQRGDSRIVLVSAAERSRAFRRARQHSLFVRGLKIALPILSVASAGLLFLLPSMLLRVAVPNLKASVAAVEITTDQLRMINPRFDGETADKGHYVVTAAAAVQSIGNADELHLETVHGHIVQADSSWTDLKAKAGLYRVKSRALRLTDGIDITTSGNAHAVLDNADVDIDKKRVRSDAAVTLSMPNGTIKGRGLLVENEIKRILLREAVTAHLIPPKSNAPAADPAAVSPALAATPAMSNAPIDISSNKLEVLDTAKTAKFSGAVHAIQAGMTLQAERLEIGYSGGQGADLSSAGPSAQTITYATAQKNVVITTADGRGATCDQSRYDQIANTMTLTGSVVLTQKDNVLRADQVVADLATHLTHITGKNRVSGHFMPEAAGSGGEASAGGLAAMSTSQSATDIEADQLDIADANSLAVFNGTVKVTQRGNKLTGEQLAIDMTQRHMTMSGPGRVTGTFEATAAPAAAVKTTQVAAATGSDPAAAGLGRSLTGLSASNGEPTNVEADSMTVEDDKGQATFTGKVIVVHGGHRITAAALTVFYNGGGAAAKAPAQLSRITAKDRVTVKTPENDVATGDTLLYDAARNQLTMTGNVTVSQGGNVIHGDRLLVDLTTGQSHFETNPVDAGGQPPGAAAKPGRIQVLITPQGIKQIGGPQVPGAPRAGKSAPKAKSALSASDVLVAPDAPQ